MNISPDPSCFSACYGLRKAQVQIPPDPYLAKLLDSQGTTLRLLDVGCGAGAYLQAQSIAYSHRGLQVYGVDVSPKMLRLAGQTIPQCDLSQGSAESLPYMDSLFDAVACRLSFHLFNKPVALDEMDRVTKPGGSLILDDLAPGQMPSWWVFHFFPGAEATTHSVFWPPEKIVQSLRKRGFKASYQLDVREITASLNEILEAAQLRDVPQLMFLGEDAYSDGLATIRQELQRQPQGIFHSQAAIVRIVGTKKLSS